LALFRSILLILDLVSVKLLFLYLTQLAIKLLLTLKGS